jgi:hypothetical protein
MTTALQILLQHLSNLPETPRKSLVQSEEGCGCGFNMGDTHCKYTTNAVCLRESMKRRLEVSQKS